MFCRSQDGSEVDITEGVQALYDLVISSMDWGSGFLNYEDAVPVAELARACGFEKAEEAERYLREQLHSREQEEFINRLNRERTDRRIYVKGFMHGQTHDHVFSSAGKCMWPGCLETYSPLT